MVDVSVVVVVVVVVVAGGGGVVVNMQSTETIHLGTEQHHDSNPTL